MYVNFTCLKVIYNRCMSYNKYRILCAILQEYIVTISNFYFNTSLLSIIDFKVSLILDTLSSLVSITK